MRIAIATMAYNERINLPIWLRHYRAQCPDAHLFVIDHGSDDGSTDALTDASLIPLPRTPFDEVKRAQRVANLRRTWLDTHDVVVFTDTDEILVADPAHHRSLAAFLDAVADPVIAPAGVHVLHDIGAEPDLDPTQPILAQRSHVEFGSGMCKPMITRVPIRCDIGFHGADHRPVYRPDLIHFHLGFIDRAIALDRLALTRTMAWSDASLAAGHGFHQRMSNADYLARSFLRPMRTIRAGAVQPFDFAPELERLENTLRNNNGFWLPNPHFWGRVAVIPDRYRRVI